MTNEGALEFSSKLSRIVQQIGEDYIDPFIDLIVAEQK
jgi:hypothetical protein